MHLVVIICFPFGLDFGLSTEEAWLVLNFWIEVKMREVFGVNCSRLTWKEGVQALVIFWPAYHNFSSLIRNVDADLQYFSTHVCQIKYGFLLQFTTSEKGSFCGLCIKSLEVLLGCYRLEPKIHTEFTYSRKKKKMSTYLWIYYRGVARNVEILKSGIQLHPHKKCLTGHQKKLFSLYIHWTVYFLSPYTKTYSHCEWISCQWRKSLDFYFD